MEDGRGRRGLGTQFGRRGVVWNREGEEGIIYRGKRWEGRKRREESKEEEDDLVLPKVLDPPVSPAANLRALACGARFQPGEPTVLT
jgi:hypothetical protein